MLYCFVSTAFAVLVVVIFMLTVAAHHLLLQLLTKKFVVIALAAVFLYLSALIATRQHHMRHQFSCTLQDLSPATLSAYVKSSETPIGCALAIVFIFTK